MFRSGATALAKPDVPEYARYTSCKIDVEVMRLVRAAASLDGHTTQDWLSDLANAAAAKRLRIEPVKRKPNQPHPKRPKRKP